jgi:hypothetical protein
MDMVFYDKKWVNSPEVGYSPSFDLDDESRLWIDFNVHSGAGGTLTFLLQHSVDGEHYYTLATITPFTAPGALLDMRMEFAQHIRIYHTVVGVAAPFVFSVRGFAKL